MKTVFCIALLAAAAGCRSSDLRDRSGAADSTVTVLMKASVPLVSGGIRRGALETDSLFVLEDATLFVAQGVVLRIGEGTDTLIVHARQGRMQLGSGAVDLFGLRFHSRAGREVTADSGKFDGLNAIQIRAPMHIDGRAIAPARDAVTYRVGTGEFTGCATGCS